MSIDDAAVLGAGSWGTAFAKSWPTRARDVTLWARRPEVAEAIRETGTRTRTTCPACRCRPAVTATADAAEAIDGADLVVLAVPSQTLRGNLAAWAGTPGPDATLVSPDEGHRAGHDASG